MPEIIRRGVGYIRLSEEDRKKHDKTELETSLINQRNDIKYYIIGRDFSFIEIYDDKYLSGDEPDRPELKRLLEDSYKNKFDVLVVKDLSRLVRNSHYQKQLLLEFQLKGIEVISLMGGLENELISEMMGFVNMVLVIIGRMNARRLQVRKQSEGKPYFNSPYGYKFNKDKQWAVDEKKGNVVRGIFESVLQKIGYKDIIKKFEISKSLYYKILKNKNYTGIITHKTKIKNAIGRTIRVDVTQYQGSYEPLINPETFNAVQELLKSRKNNLSKPKQ